jgi:hypothetical protein
MGRTLPKYSDRPIAVNVLSGRIVIDRRRTGLTQLPPRNRSRLFAIADKSRPVPFNRGRCRHIPVRANPVVKLRSPLGGVCGYSALWLRRIDSELAGMELKRGSPIRRLAENR